MKLFSSILKSYQGCVEEGTIGCIQRMQWDDIYFSYDSSTHQQSRHTIFSIAMLSGATREHILREIGKLEQAVLKEKISYKRLRDEKDVNRMEDFLNIFDKFPLMTLTLSIEPNSWGIMQRYIKEIFNLDYPEFHIQHKLKLTKVFVISQMIESLLLISIPKHSRIAVLLDTDDFSSNMNDLAVAKSMLGNALVRATGLNADHIGIETKEKFREIPELMALLAVPDIFAGALGEIEYVEESKRALKANTVESFIINSRKQPSCAHFTGELQFNSKRSTASLHSWYRLPETERVGSN